MKKKFVLIEPKSSHLHVYSQFAIPRLGVILLGTMLRNIGWDVKVFIEDIAPIDMAEVFSADVVGISLLTSTAPQSYRLADAVRSSGIPVVLGGTHVTFLPDEALDHADFVVRGEGEETLFELISAMNWGPWRSSSTASASEGMSPFVLSEISGLSYWKNGLKAHNPDRPLKEDLDSNPIPDYGLVHGWKNGGLISIATSRGCPFTCSFCSVPGMYGHGMRMHSIDRVLEEIRVNQPKYIFFADDLFTANRKRTKDLLRRMIEEGLTPQWGAQVRIETAFDPELLELFKASNCFNVFVGFESINPKTLDLFNKRQTYEKIVASIQKFKEAGIRIHGMFVVGSDFDDRETIIETARFAEKWGMESIQLMILTPLPGSPDYDRLYATGARELLTKDWSLYDGHHVVYRPRNMTAYELNKSAIDGMVSFYSWKTIFRSLMRMDISSVIIQYGANRLLSRWKAENQYWLNGLRDDLYRKSREIQKSASGGLKYSVAVPRFLLETDYGRQIYAVLSELGLKIIPFGDLSDSGPSRFEWLKGKVDCVIMPVMEKARQGEEVFFERIQGLRKSLTDQGLNLPTLVQLFLDRQDGSFYSSIAQIGVLASKDLDRVHKAMRGMLPMLSAETINLQTMEAKPVIIRS